MEPTEEQKEHINDLLAVDDKIEAIRYVQKEFQLDAESAITFIERWEQELGLANEAEFEQARKQASIQSVNVSRLVGNIFGGIGLILLALSAYFAYRSHTFLQRALPAEGTVVELVQSMVHNSEEKTDYPVWSALMEYEFRGKTYRFKSPFGSSQPDHQIGDRVALLVDPDQPGEPEEDTFFGRWFVTLLLGGMGLIFTGVGFTVARVFGR